MSGQKIQDPFDFKYVTVDTEQGSDNFPVLLKARIDLLESRLQLTDAYGLDGQPEGAPYGCLVSFGFNLRDMKTKQVVEKWGKVFPFSDSDFGKRCFQEFWDNEERNPGIRAMLAKCKVERDRLVKAGADKMQSQPHSDIGGDASLALAIYDACKEVADKVDEWDLEHKPWYLSDFSSYDIGSLNAVFTIAGRPHIGYMCTGLNEDGTKKYDFKRIEMHSTSFYRSICSESFGKMWGSEQNAMDKYQIKKPKHIVHDHDPVNDAESISWIFAEIYHAHYAHLQKIDKCYHCKFPNHPYYTVGQHIRKLVLDEVETQCAGPLKDLPFPSEEIREGFISANLVINPELEKDIEEFIQKINKHISVGSKRPYDIAGGFAMGAEFAISKLQKTLELDDVAVAEIRKASAGRAPPF